jgi:AcrR family transcriptional regulator
MSAGLASVAGEGEAVAVKGSAVGRRDATKAANRAAILEAGRQVFGELGYEATTVRDIIRRTELASGTFYNYFKSKEEVFHALHVDGISRFQPLLREAYESSDGDFAVFLSHACEAYFRFLIDNPPPGAVMGAAPGALDAKPDWTRVRLDTPESLALSDQLRDYLGHFAAEGGPLAGINAELMSASCIGMAQELGERMLRGRVTLDEAISFYTELVLGGLTRLAGAGRHP